MGSPSINLKLSNQTPDSRQVLSDIQQRTFAGQRFPLLLFRSMFCGILTCHKTCTEGLLLCSAATDVLEGHSSSFIIKQEREGVTKKKTHRLG